MSAGLRTEERLPIKILSNKIMPASPRAAATCTSTEKKFLIHDVWHGCTTDIAEKQN